MLEEIVNNLRNYVDDFAWAQSVEPIDRWDCVNYLIGYYKEINKVHIEAIELLVREGVIAR